MSDDDAPGGGQTPRDGTFVDEARRYELGSRIATGGMGEVWRGTDTVLNRAVAIKLLKAEYADDPTFRSRFETEARHAASLHHPGVAAVYDFGEAGATDGSQVHRPYLVMELVDGQPLSALLLPGQPLDPDVSSDLMAQAADAIGAAHIAGIVHRDVKPANLLVTPDGTVKITDFGIARAAEGMALTETGQVMGTPQYLSPEQAQGLTATPASDVYSLAVVAFECLAGRRPFVADSAVATALAHLREPVPDLPPEIPADLAAVVRRAMSKTPDERFPDGTAFAAALRDPSSVPPPAGAVSPPPATDATQVLAGVAPVAAAAPLTTSTPTAPPTSHTAGRRVPWAWILLAVAIVAGIITVAVLAGGGDDDPTTPEPTRKSTPKEPKDPTGPKSTPTEAETTEPTTEPSPTPSEEETTEEPSETASPTDLPTETETTEESPTPSESPATETSPSVAQSGQPSKSPVSTPSPSASASASQVSGSGR